MIDKELEPYITVPTNDNGVWTTTAFATKEEFRLFILTLFKEPGKYEFDETSFLFNAEARKFNNTKVFCLAPYGSVDFIEYWDDQKAKCRLGCLFINKDKQWYLPRDYYMWLNFLPIYNKEINKYGFADVRDAQYHLALYELLAELHNLHVALLKKRQIAEQPHSEPVLGEKGWTTMGDVQPGDKLWNPDGTLTTILDKSDNGLSDVYEFELRDGRKTRCGIGHNWAVYDRTAKKEKVLNTKELIERGLQSTPIKGKKKIQNNYRFSIKNCSPIPGNNIQLPVNPYILGCLLGDGHINNQSVYISGGDEQIFNEISNLLGEDFELKIGGYCKRNITYKKRFSEECKKFKNGQYGCNPLLRDLHDLGLGVTGKNTKFIPEIYKTASISDRIYLLQGLLDTDGYINAKGINIHFTNTNKNLIDDVAYIARSLGLKTTISNKFSRDDTPFYRLLFSGDINFQIFRLQRKLDRFAMRKGKKFFTQVPIVSITKLDYKEKSSCIIVDNPNHLYITKDFIVTHNSSYYHCAKFINQLWFEEGVTLKMGASMKDYINEKGNWKFLEEYRSFLNTHTAWFRHMNPGKILMWQQKVEMTVGRDKRKVETGLKGTIQGVTFDKDPTNSVGGPCRFFYHEEAGIAPKMHITYEYLLPALKSGHLYTGMFIAAGSVGDLSQCKPLKDMIEYPVENDIYPIETNLIDDTGMIGLSGLFIPEQWSMPPYIDNYGNSLVDEALQALEDEFTKLKKQLSPEMYQLRISQHPRNIKEAFASRKVAKFPKHLVDAQIRRIKDKEYAIEYMDIFRNAEGHPELKASNKAPISEFPIRKDMENKEGIICIYERPIANPEFRTYYASIDPVSEGKSTTSDSLCAIYIYKNTAEVTKHQGEISETYIEQGKIVASWCGRFDDIDKTHERLELLLEIYNAWTIVENNVGLFIQHMIKRRKQRYLVPKDQIMFLKDLGANKTVYQEYGWKNTGTLFKTHMLSYGIEFLQEELDHETKADGSIVRTTYGVERLPDIMLLTEMEAYEEGLNVDRLIAYCALIAFIRIQDSNIGYRKEKIILDTKNLDKSKNISKLNNSPFRHLGRNISNLESSIKRSAYKNLK